MAGDQETAAERVPTTERQRRGLLTGLLVPPLVWLAQLEASYALVPWVCSSGHRWALVLLALLAAVMAAAAGYAAWASWPGTSRLGGEPRGVEGARLLSIVGVALSAAVVIFLIASLIPTVVLRPCD